MLPLPTRARNVSGNTLEEEDVDGTAVGRKVSLTRGS